MGVLNAQDLFQSAAREEAAVAAKPKVKSKIYLNFGIPKMLPNLETGEMEEHIISLPVNIGLDTMRPREIPTKAPKTASQKRFQDLLIASNKLHENLLKMSMRLEPGQAEVFARTKEGFVLQIQRIAEDQDVENISEEGNEYLDAIDAMFAARK